MIEIKRFYYTDDWREMNSEPLMFYMINKSEIALLHFLERELGDCLMFPDYLESPFAKDIVTKDNQSRYFLNEFEGYLAVQRD